MTDFSELASRLSGPVLTPGEPGFDDEVAGFNLAMERRPDAVVGVASADDVVAAVRFAREHGLKVRAQATGHGTLVPIVDGILLTTSRLDHVRIDPAAKTATFGAGVRAGELAAAAAEHGLAPILGASPTVGAVGLLLGGGLGPLVRSHGVASDYVESMSLVTGAGELVQASADSEPDLFWALRGGKGGLGVVVEATIRLVDLDTLYGGTLFFDIADAQAVLGGWIDWCDAEADGVSTSVAIIRFPDLDVVPPPLRGRHLLGLRFAYPGATSEGARLAAPLRALAPVVLDTVAELPAAEIARVHNDPTRPGMSWGRGMGLTDLDRGFVAALLSSVGANTNAPFVAVELRHVASDAVARDVEGGSAVGARDTQFVLHLIGVPNPALFDTVLPAMLADTRTRLLPWLAESVPINWVSDPWVPEQLAGAWPSATRARLAQIRAANDPDGILPYPPVASS